MERNVFVTNGGMSKQIAEFLGDGIENILMIPYAIPKRAHWASVKEHREEMEPLGYRVHSITGCKNPRDAVENAEAIMIPGGNTHVLLNEMYENDIVYAVREKGLSGTPIIGKSAGAGVLGPTIKTTNDWAVVGVPSLDATGILPYQINPHFPAAWNKLDMEERAGRIGEFRAYNPGVPVIGLMEGSNLTVRGDETVVGGFVGSVLFDETPKYVRPGTVL